MKTRVLGAALALLLSFPALAADASECVLSDEALRPQVDATKLPKGWKLVSAGRKERAHREVFALPDGLELTVSIYGCAHLGLSVALKSRKAITMDLKPADAIALLRKTSEATPYRADAHLADPILKDGFAALKELPAAFPVPIQCGEYETCSVTLVQNEKKEPVLSFNYDYPL